MRKPIIVGNWKMNKTNAEAKEFFNEIEKVLHDKATFGVGAPFTALNTCQEAAKNMIVAAQNCHFEDAGAFTGEISVGMLKDLGVKWCIIGHSERRQMFNETDQAINKKAAKLIANGMTPIVCVGETLAEFEKGITEDVVRSQIDGCLKGLDPKAVSELVLAYEPVWAIGTGKSATKEIAQNTCAICRNQVEVMFGKEVADKVRIQYGGSVNPSNIAEYMAMEDIDGALIGGASLKVDSFTDIINALK